MRRRFRCSELESKAQRWEKCVISLPTAWLWNHGSQSRCLFLEQDGVKPSERQSVGFFISTARYVGTLTRNLFIRVPALSDTPWSCLVLGLIRLPFYPFPEMESTQTFPTTAIPKGLVLWLENFCNQL